MGRECSLDDLRHLLEALSFEERIAGSRQVFRRDVAMIRNVLFSAEEAVDLWLRVAREDAAFHS